MLFLGEGRRAKQALPMLLLTFYSFLLGVAFFFGSLVSLQRAFAVLDLYVI